jgi:hypothetical protein
MNGRELQSRQVSSQVQANGSQGLRGVQGFIRDAGFPSRKHDGSINIGKVPVL